MHEEHSFNVSERLRSFRYAANGISLVVRSQHNAWVHAAATIIVCSCGLWANLTRLEWCCLLLAIVGVWIAEALNTAIELITDLVSPQFNSLAGKGKDVAAGAVLVAAIGAVVVGLIIFVPHLSSH